MTTPAFLMAGVLAFWGWQTGLLYFGMAMGVILEGARWVRVRWELSEEDLQRVWTLCTLLFLGGTVISFVANDGAGGVMGLLEAGGIRRTEALNATTRSVLVLLQWMPLVFFPMMAAQAYGQRVVMDARVFSWILRRRQSMNPALATPIAFNVSYPYILIVLVSTSTAGLHRELFFAGFAVVVGWVLWGERSPRHSWGVWVAVFLGAGFLGFGGQLGLRQLQGLVQQWDASWLSRGTEMNDRSSTVTEMGVVGRLKLSGRIVLRVDAETRPVPELLREVSYNQFQSPDRWYSADKKLDELIPDDETTWTLVPAGGSEQSVSISRRMGRGGRGLLAVPSGTTRLEQLAALVVKTNGMGVVRVQEGPGVLTYRARFGPGATLDGPPEPADLEVPGEESEAVRRVAAELGLSGLGPGAVLPAVRELFQERFEYSTFLEAAGGEGRTPLADFLLNRRSGHCEYFAAASVFLLRNAGIPARYAVGYSVQEKRGDRYVVRGRHAHAWCLAFVDGRWIDFDATPGSWNAIESRRAGFWEPGADFFSDLWFAFSEWRWSGQSIRGYLPWLLVPPIGVVLYRLIVRRRWSRAGGGASPGMGAPEWPGTDSEWYQVERALRGRGLERERGETIRSWVGRVRESDEDVAGAGDLEAMMELHYRYRFDPAGLQPGERRGLREAAAAWMEKRKG